MSRPTDWHVLDLSRDPVPGDPGSVASLARRLQRVADDAERAEREVRGLAGDGAVLSWVGLAAEVFRGALDEFPSQLGKLASSYGQAAGALSAFGRQLDTAQDSADRALVQGRAARAEIDSLSSQLSTASSAASSAAGTADRLRAPLPAGAEPPDPDQVRAATRNAQAANQRVSSLSSSLGGAQDRLEAAKRLARDAQELRERAATQAARRLRDASDDGMQPESAWERFKGAAGKLWDATIRIAKVAVLVLGVVALVIGGPLAWVVVGLAVLLVADALMKVASGEGTWMDVLWAGLSLIPGTRGITTLSRLATGVKGLRSGISLTGTATRAARGLAAVANDAPLMVRQALSNAPARLRHMAAQLRHASPGAAVRAGTAAFRDARAAGDGLWSALSAAETARYKGFREGFDQYASTVSRTNPVRGVELWQGGDGFFGIDPWRRDDLVGGELLARGTGGRGDFVVSADDVPQFTDGALHNGAIQVPPYGANPTFRPGVELYEMPPRFAHPSATAPVVNNPQFGPGGMPQRFVPGFQDLVDSGIARPVLQVPFAPGTLAGDGVPTAAEAVTVRTATHAPVRTVVYGQAGQD